MQLTCIIIEDEPLAQEILEYYVFNTKDIVSLGTFSDLQKFDDFSRDKVIDIIFLDINLKGIGFEEIKYVIERNSFIIVVTAYPVSFLGNLNKKKITSILNKPMSFKVFKESVENVMRLKLSAQLP